MNERHTSHRTRSRLPGMRTRQASHSTCASLLSQSLSIANRNRARRFKSHTVHLCKLPFGQVIVRAFFPNINDLQTMFSDSSNTLASPCSHLTASASVSLLPVSCISSRLRCSAVPGSACCHVISTRAAPVPSRIEMSSHPSDFLPLFSTCRLLPLLVNCSHCARPKFRPSRCSWSLCFSESHSRLRPSTRRKTSNAGRVERMPESSLRPDSPFGLRGCFTHQRAFSTHDKLRSSRCGFEQRKSYQLQSPDRKKVNELTTVVFLPDSDIPASLPVQFEMRAQSG